MFTVPGQSQVSSLMYGVLICGTEDTPSSCKSANRRACTIQAQPHPEERLCRQTSQPFPMFRTTKFSTSFTPSFTRMETSAHPFYTRRAMIWRYMDGLRNVGNLCRVPRRSESVSFRRTQAVSLSEFHGRPSQVVWRSTLMETRSF